MRSFKGMRWLRGLGLLSLLTVLAWTVAGCGGGGGGGGASDTTPPDIDISYTKSTSADSSAAGTVTVDATITDASGVSSAVLVVQAPTGQVSKPMTSANGVYTAAYSYSANTGTADLTYRFSVRATDGSGQTGESPSYSFVVKAPDQPPPPPF